MTAATCMADPVANASSNALCAVIERSAAEARYWAECVADLEAQLATVRSTSPPATALQTLDFVRQGLEGLSSFLQAIAAQTDPAVVCSLEDPLTGVAMQLQVDRLSGAAPRHNKPLHRAELWDD